MACRLNADLPNSRSGWKAVTACRGRLCALGHLSLAPRLPASIGFRRRPEVSMSDVFISYARSTEAQAHQVAEALRARPMSASGRLSPLRPWPEADAAPDRSGWTPGVSSERWLGPNPTTASGGDQPGGRTLRSASLRSCSVADDASCARSHDLAGLVSSSAAREPTSLNSPRSPVFVPILRHGTPGNRWEQKRRFPLLSENIE